MNKSVVLFRGTSSEMYQVVGISADRGIANVDSYAAYNKKYTPAFFEALKTAAEEAAALPDYSHRQATSTNLRNALASANGNVCTLFTTSMGYIRSSFAPDDIDAMKKLAGSDLFAEAYGEKWGATKALIIKAESFIDTYLASLAAGGMPEEFPAAVAAAGETFTTALTTFNNFKSNASSGTSAKIDADNSLYQRLQAVLGDSKIVFAADSAMKKQCSYSALLKKVKGTGKSGFRILLEAAGTLARITTASIQFMPTGKTFVANREGVIKDALPEGKYNYTLTAPGYAPVHGTLHITAGVVRHKKIEMTTAAALAATA